MRSKSVGCSKWSLANIIPTRLQNKFPKCQKSFGHIAILYNKIIFSIEKKQTEMLIVPQVLQFTFNLQSLKIVQIQPAHENTFVLLVIDQQVSFEQILHLTSAGHILNKYSFQCSINSIAMVSPHQISTIMVECNCVIVIDLVKSTTQKIAHMFNRQAIDGIELFVFPLSSLFCIQEYSVHTRKTLKLTYYTQTLKQVELCYEQQSQQLQNMMFTCKSNNYSQIAWYVRNYKENYEEIVLHDIVTNHNSKKESRLRRIRIKDTTFIDYSTSSLLNIIKIWRLRQHQYLLILTPQDILDDEDQVYDYLVLNQQNKTIRIPQFRLPTNSKQLVTDVNFRQEFTLFVTHNLQNPDPYASRNEYLIDNRTEQLIKNTQVVDYAHLQNFFPSYEYSTLIKAQYMYPENKIKLFIDKIFRVQQTYLHFLLTINQNFDEDLLQDSLQLLEPQKQK